MAEKMMRLSQVARKLNVGKNTIIEALEGKGYEVDNSPNAKISMEQFNVLAQEFESSLLDKEEASSLTIGTKHNEDIVIEQDTIVPKADELEKEILIKGISAPEAPKEVEKLKEEMPKTKLQGIKVIGKIDLNPKKKEDELVPKKEEEVKKEVKKEEIVESKEEKVAEEKKESEPASKNALIKAKADTLKGLKVVGKIDLPVAKEKKAPAGSSDRQSDRNKKKRPRKRVAFNSGNKGTQQGGDRRKGGFANKKKRVIKEELTDKEIQDKIKATLARLSGGKVDRAKYRREKRSSVADATEEQMQKEQEESKVLKVTEYISANDLASLMDVSVNEVISTCMSLGMFVSINQRLDAEAITIIADEFNYNVEFTTTEDEVVVVVAEDTEESLIERAPIVTIMGHVDHGKTSLLDYIRSTNVTDKEAGGITQHIGAYDVVTSKGKRIAFLDTPGHEAFTAMRARGAKVTDIVIIVIAADDSVMPQTKEALNHAQNAGVPIVIAINKIDRPNANPDRIKEALSAMNILVEDWGGKYQCQNISAKTGEGIDDLLEKVLLEAELLELKANPNKNAIGTVIEASLDKGRGYVTTLLVQEGTLRVGDIVLAGSHFGKVKAMFDHLGTKLKEVGPATPVQILGFAGAPSAGEQLNVMDSDREAREIANKREQIQREQSIRTKKHITLDEIGRRLAIGTFKELNIIVKGDVDGSVEALSDSLLKLSTEEIQVNIIHKAVGQISESDVLLASASDAIVIGFQVRPSPSARKLADTEDIQIKLYSIIYAAIDEIKDAMEGLLAPTVEEIITGNIEVREIFKISKVGTIAGCYVLDGYVKRSNQIRLIRDGIVTYTGNIGQLKRFKDDVTEVKKSFECGISIKGFNDIKVGDVIEGFEEREIKRKL